MEPSGKILDELKSKGQNTLTNFREVANRAKNIILGPPPPEQVRKFGC